MVPRDQVEQVAKLTEAHANYKEVMVLQKWNVKLLAEQFKLPEMELEIERAVAQVEGAIKAKQELTEEKNEIKDAVANQQDKKEQ